MNEREWLTSTDPRRMIQWVARGHGEQTPGKDISDRKLRMWVEACRAISKMQVGAYNLDYQLHDAVAVWSERNLPRQLPDAETRAALLRDVVGNPFRQVKWWRLRKNMLDLGPSTHESWVPYEHVVPILRWESGIIPTLAQSMYDSRDFSKMPILGDMLEDAGCTDPQILEHCRRPTKITINTGPGDYGDEYLYVDDPHVRGCWVVDLILGKE